MIVDGPIERFFKNPCSEPSQTGDCIIFHLRRDLEMLYGKESQFKGIASSHAMLAMLGILAGIDYLSKVYSAQNGSRKKFVETITELYKITIDESEAIYQLRCSLVHNVALSNISNCSYRKGTRFIFKISDNKSDPLITKLLDTGNEVEYSISFWKLKEAFLKVIRELENIARDVGHSKNVYVLNKIGHMHSEKINKN